MVEQAELTHASLDMISYGHIVMCIYPHTALFSIIEHFLQECVSNNDIRIFFPSHIPFYNYYLICMLKECFLAEKL
jgi:hypothetical protein